MAGKEKEAKGRGMKEKGCKGWVHRKECNESPKPFIGFWQPRKAGLNKHTGISCIHNIHKNTSHQIE